jgi:sigma-E factor negative regulatory protein RseB
MLLLILLHAVAAAAQAPAEDWRRWALRMDKAQRSLNYDATLVVDAGNGDWDLLELSQRVGPGGPEQQWAALNGAGRRQVRTAQGVSILGPEGDQRIGHGPQLRAGPLLAQLDQHYRISMDPRERVAGRRALKMTLQPLSEDRYGLRLWIDVDTGLPLRSERFGADQQMLERRMVTRLVVHGFAGLSAVPATAAISDNGWKLPAGFRLVGSALTVPGIAGARQWVISDGVAWVSIYQMQLPPGLAVDSNGWRHGALSQVTVRRGDEWFYLLGDLPPETLLSVGRAASANAR